MTRTRRVKECESKGIPGDEEELPRQRELQVLGVAKKMEGAVCADERSVRVIRLTRASAEYAPGNEETEFWAHQAKECGLEHREGNRSHAIILIRERTWYIGT